MPHFIFLNTLFVNIRKIFEASALFVMEFVLDSEISLTLENSQNLERVQKTSLKIILKSDYNTYRNALELTSLTTLSERRSKLCLNFAKKCLKNPEMKQMFPLNPNKEALDTRFREKFKVDNSRTDRHKNSAIPYMQRLLNKYANK